MENGIFIENTLKIDDSGKVIGYAYTKQFKDGKSVQIGVFSYEYEKHGKKQLNHVPNVTVVDKDGKIIKEPHSHDSKNPQKAIENALGLAKDIYKNPDSYF